MNIPNELVKPQNPNVACPACHGKAWLIYHYKISCCRCGLSYATPNITSLDICLIQDSVPPFEVLKALEIFDSPER